MKDIEDDGRVISSMDFEEITGVKAPFFSKRSHSKKSFGLHVTFRERFAMIRAAYKVVLPIALGFVTLFFITFLLMDWLWLS